MERRDFIRLTVAGASASLISPALTLAAVYDQPKDLTEFEANEKLTNSSDIYFTEKSPGRWVGKEATHLPLIEITKAEDGTSVKITTTHEMKGYEHYIVKHVLLDKNYKFIDEHLFDPTKDLVAVSTFVLKNYNGKVYALSLCNKHDLWLNSAAV
jgi:superoxide reductase